LGIWRRLLARFRQAPELFNLQIEPGYAIKASARSPYFQAIERAAREGGYLGAFVADQDGRLRPGTQEALPTLHATLALDVYPNPAAIEGRTVVDYDDPHAPRRAPRAIVALDDGSELFLWHASDGLRIAGAALEQAQKTSGGHGDRRL
jgi:hypothetical protein